MILGMCSDSVNVQQRPMEEHPYFMASIVNTMSWPSQQDYRVQEKMQQICWRVRKKHKHSFVCMMGNAMRIIRTYRRR